MFGANRLEKLIKRRDNQWNSLNEKIVQELSSSVALSAIKSFMVQVRGDRAAERLQIKGADILKHDKYPDGMLAIWGSSTFEEGEEVLDDDGQVITLTKAQAEILTLPIHINIPIILVRAGDVTTIVEYLIRSFVEAKKLAEEMYQAQLEEQEQNTSGDSVAEYMYNMLNEINEPEPVPELDMDLSEFSEDEQLMIRNSYKKNGNKIQ